MPAAPAPLPHETVVGVVGAGTMGRGIARVAAQAGHDVVLTDSSHDVIGAALTELRTRLERDVERGRLAAEAADSIHGRIVGGDDLEALRSCGLVIEAIVEDLDVKRAVFSRLEALVAADTILASNTSSLSITAIAAAAANPERIIGIHFFNPAPLLPLVEVVAGLATDPGVLATVRATVEGWGKTPVVCASTPGFIVNRIARPFYLEPLRMLEEGYASAEDLDAAFVGAGFRMGPFALLDLIGLDVNLAVSKSVYGQLFEDPRLRPSPVQQQLVDAGRLGRKTNAGFYGYPDGPGAARYVTPVPVDRVEMVGDPGHGAALADRLGDIRRLPADELPGRLVIDGRAVYPTPAHPGPGEAAFDLVSDWGSATAVAAAGSEAAVASLAGALEPVGVRIIRVRPGPGLVVMRTVAMLAAVAADAVSVGVAAADDVDVAMRLGVNYPRGPFEWSEHIGHDGIDATLVALRDQYGEERYRPIIRG